MISRPSDPLEAVIARLRGANQPRIGDRSARLWWVCPFHKDVNPSLCVEPGSSHYKCFGCGASGDAIDFVRRLDPSISFKEAVAVTGGELAPSREFRPATPAPRRQPPARPEGWQAFARAVVEQAERLLWTPNGSQTLAYLQARGLTLDTIRAARLGLHPGDSYASRVFPDGNVFVPHGIVIPWFEGEDLALVNVRRPQAHKRYWALRGSRKGGIYPSRSVIVAGRPLVLAEGEMDALLLGQELADLTPVVTMGSASDKPKPAALGAMLGARPWLVASDADSAGDISADHWLARYDRCRRVRSPIGKDWTEAYKAGVNLRRWWADHLAGDEAPPPFTWDDLATWRWGPAVGDPTPGLIVPDPRESKPSG